MKQFKMLLLSSMVMLFTACGGGSSSSVDAVPINPDTPQTIAIDKITAYADDSTLPAPTIEDYIDAGVTGVTSENINDVNEVVEGLTEEDVDTTEEIQKIVDDLGVNILPTANAGSDKFVEGITVVMITGSGTDSDGTIVSYEWTNGTTVLATTASFDYLPTVFGTDTLTLTVMDDDGGIASDSMNVTVMEGPPPPPDLVSITIAIPDTIEVSTSEPLSAVGNYSDTSDKDITNLVTWSSSNTSIASILGSTVTGKSEGDVTITAELNGISQSSQMEVTPYIWWNHLSVGKSMGVSCLNGYCTYTYAFTIKNDSSEDLTVESYVTTNSETSEVIDSQITSSNLEASSSVQITRISTSSYPGIDLVFTLKDTMGIVKTFSVTWDGDLILLPAVNNPPVADAGADLGVQVYQPITITGTGTDSDGTITSYEWRKDGALLASTASFEYTPNTVGADTLTLTVTDNDGATASDTMSITVTTEPVVNNPPVATFSSFSTDEDIEYTGTLTATDADEGAVLSYRKINEPLYGTLVVNTNGSFSYIPHANYNGRDSFQYSVNDGIYDSNIQEVTIAVNPINDAPIVADIDISGDSRSILEGNINASDAESDTLTYTVQTIPSFGVFMLDTVTGDFTFEPQSSIGLTKAVVEVTDGENSVSLDINFDISQKEIGTLIQMCDSYYNNGYNDFNVENGLIQRDSDITLNITNTLDGNISITSGKLYNGKSTEIYSFTSNLESNQLVKASATYYSDTTSFENYWVIKFKDVASNKNYITKYTYNSLEGMSISSSVFISSLGVIGCYDDTPYNGTYITEEDLGFDIEPIDDMLVSETTMVALGLNDAIINNNAEITVILEPSEGMSATYSEGMITFELIDGEDKANTYIVTVIASQGVNSDTEVFEVEYALQQNVSTVTEFRQALVNASQNANNDVIVLADGIYTTTEDGLGEFRFTDSESYKLRIKGSSADNVILSGDSTNRVLYIYNAQTSTSFTLENLTIQDGYVDGDGAGIKSNIDLYCHHIVVKNNITTTYGDGGGMYAYNSIFANLWLHNSIVENNSGDIGGGFRSWNVEVKNSIIRGNRAYSAGGFDVQHAQVYNSIIASNVSEGNAYGGGAFHVFSDLSLVNSLVIDNDTGISISASIGDSNNYIVNSILSNNGTFDVKSVVSASVEVSNTYTDGVWDIPHFETDVITSGDLGFVDDNNGNYHLLSGSVLIDSGTNSYTGVTIPTTDFDGNPRPVGASIDIGPYEYQ